MDAPESRLCLTTVYPPPPPPKLAFLWSGERRSHRAQAGRVCFENGTCAGEW